MTDINFQKVAVLGAGTMGAGIAQICAQAGSEVVLCDLSTEVHRQEEPKADTASTVQSITFTLTR